MIIEIGWWALPAAISLIAFGWFWIWFANDPPSSGYGNIGRGLGQGLFLLCAIIVTLVAWLVYFVVTP